MSCDMAKRYTFGLAHKTNTELTLFNRFGQVAHGLFDFP